MDIINEYLKKYSEFVNVSFGLFPKVVKRLECKDGYSVSIQANEYAYCNPRENAAWPYDEVELGFPSEPDDLIMDYAENPDIPVDTVYGYVPIEFAVKLIEKHGGIKNG